MLHRQSSGPMCTTHQAPSSYGRPQPSSQSALLVALPPDVRAELSDSQREGFNLQALWIDALERCRHILSMIDFRRGRFVYMSPQQVELSGIPLERWLSMNWEENQAFIYPDDLRLLRKRIDRIHRSAKPNDVKSIELTYRRLRPDGSIYWVHEWSTCYYD